MDKCVCGAPIKCVSRGECAACYRRNWLEDQLNGVQRRPVKRPRACVVCGAPFTPRAKKSVSCSRACAAKRAAVTRWAGQDAEARSQHAALMHAGRWVDKTTRSCGCGHIVPWYEGRYLKKCDDCVGLICKEDACVNPVPRHSRYCPPCAESRRKAQRAATRDSSTLVCCEIDCDRPVRARSVCNMHYKRLLRAEGRLVSPAWDDRRRNNYHARRARLAGGRNGDAVMLAELLARDGYRCGICGDSVDADAAYPDPLSKSIDHIVPLSRGGAHSPENCQLAHLRCNVSKGAKLAA